MQSSLSAEPFVFRRFNRQALKWVRPKDLRNYPMPPADPPLIPHLEELLGQFLDAVGRFRNCRSPVLPQY
jgi:hypothetical protein